MSNPAFLNYIKDINSIYLELEALVNKGAKDKYYGGKDSMGQPHGRGKIQYADGSFYEGDVVHGIRHGQGKFIFIKNEQDKKAVYTGEWADDKIEGKGIMEYLDGSKYEGRWKNGIKDGIGKFVNTDGNQIEEEWNYGDKTTGSGTFILDDGSEYHGALRDGKRTGYGKCKFPWNDPENRLSYQGEWLNDVFHGQGIIFLNDKSKFAKKQEGEFKDGKMNGNGTTYLTTGSKYIGEHKEGKFNGKGAYYWVDGTRYEGEFENNDKNGKGSYHWPDGSIYEGEIKHALRHGRGVETTAKGNKYIGEFRDDKMNGEIIEYDRNGREKFRGIMKNSIYFSGKLYEWDIWFEGEFDSYGLPSKGFYYSEDGNLRIYYDGNTYQGYRRDNFGQFDGTFYEAPDFCLLDGYSNGYLLRYGPIIRGMLNGKGIKKYKEPGWHFRDLGSIIEIEGQFVSELPTGSCLFTFENGQQKWGEGDGKGEIKIQY